MLFIFLFFRFTMGGVESPYQVSIVIFTLELNCYAIAPIFLPFLLFQDRPIIETRTRYPSRAGPPVF